MKILILGAGQVGSTAAFSLAREEANEVTIVDRNADVLRELQDRLDVRTVVGNASHPDVLERAGARDADMLIALTSSDEINMLACQIALTLFRTPTRIARIRARALDRQRGAVRPRRHSRRRRDQPFVARHGLHRTADRLPRRTAGPRVRRRQSASGRDARRSRRRARRPPAQRSGEAHSERRKPGGGDLPRRQRRHPRRQHRRRGRRRGVLPRGAQGRARPFCARCASSTNPRARS